MIVFQDGVPGWIDIVSYPLYEIHLRVLLFFMSKILVYRHTVGVYRIVIPHGLIFVEVVITVMTKYFKSKLSIHWVTDTQGLNLKDIKKTDRGVQIFCQQYGHP